MAGKKSRPAEIVVKCSRCRSSFVRKFGEPSVLECCDDCARILYKDGARVAKLHDAGVSIRRIRGMGLDFRLCPICHHRLSLQEGRTHCPTHGFADGGWLKMARDNGVKIGALRITKSYEKTDEPACKTVVCHPMDNYVDAIFAAFPGVMGREEFTDARLAIMKEACHGYVKPSVLAAAIFYMVAIKKDPRAAPSQYAVGGVVGTSPAAIWRYINKYGPAIDYAPVASTYCRHRKQPAVP